MPNWVFNNLSVTGDAVDLAAFKEAIAAPYDTIVWDRENYVDGKVTYKPSVHSEPLSFWNAIAPTDLEAYWYPKPKPRDPEQTVEQAMADIQREFAEDNDWYSWNVRNWGTKWEACNVYLNDEMEGELSYDFDTAWSIPEPALIAMSAKFPTLNFDLHAEEETGWGAEIVFKAGVANWVKDWDVPMSHEDYVSLDRECWACNSVERNDDGTWDTSELYADCPDPDFEELEKSYQEAKAYFEKQAELRRNSESDTVVL